MSLPPTIGSAGLTPGEIVQPTGVTILHSTERREVAVRFVCPNRGPLTVILPQMAAEELVRMLGAELNKLTPIAGETLVGARRDN
ncbi:MAG: hypothetical protein NVSMB18_33960 [Acetobacteraceae bacterium]